MYDDDCRPYNRARQMSGTFVTHKATIVGLGEILWDIFPDGPRFGGAPANFACSAAGLARDDAEVFMVSNVGQDDLGRQAIESLKRHRVDTSYVASINWPTGKVLVKIDDAGQASYDFATDTAWDNLAWSAELMELATRTDAVCFGTLGQRSESSRKTIQQFVASTPKYALRVFDINLRPPFFSDPIILESLELANILKLNDEELPTLQALCGLSGSTTKMLAQLANRFDLRAVALTRGAEGALIMSSDEVSEQPGVETQVVDTVGAGDAFTAAFILGLLDAEEFDTINQHACHVASFVCSQPGATPDLSS